MRIFILAAALVFPLAAQTQPARDTTSEGSALDPEAKARVRTEGAGRHQRREDRRAKERRGLERQEGGRVHDETSSDREEGRGARGAIR